MADIGSAIRAVLAADVAVAALVSTRIYPDQLPQNVTYPAIHYEVGEERSTEHMGGLSGLAESVLEIVCWSTTRLQATAMADAVRLALANYQGTSAGVTVRRVHTGTGFTDTQRPADGSETYIYEHNRDYHAFYCEATS